MVLFIGHAAAAFVDQKGVLDLAPVTCRFPATAFGLRQRARPHLGFVTKPHDL